MTGMRTTRRIPDIVTEPLTWPPQTLFEPADVEPPKCRACGATRKNLCEHDADLEHGLVSVTRRRPKTCLAAYDPSTAPIPF